MNRQEAAETLALEALGWLAAQDDLFTTFLAASGAGVADLAQRARDPDFLGSVLDFLLAEDDWILAFSRDTGHPPTAPARARADLPGGAQQHWT
ncbi:DUF3572 domain-containing protein [Szabonella alba]|uniref:DUF3572 domain-containing protein n=1 Tax=Szabonella alba TaxID=2804194 RepID=A0A8K0Y022_9RHOB|nr:DUF3572 domain-containing protein [Szabonella alba]MBL4916382.1 DUF3572 domain-containing protein [Szabonella alba]